MSTALAYALGGIAEIVSIIFRLKRETAAFMASPFAKLFFLTYLFYKIRTFWPTIRAQWENVKMIKNMAMLFWNQYSNATAPPSDPNAMNTRNTDFRQHFSRNATTIACKWSVNTVDEQIAYRYTPAINTLQESFRLLKQNKPLPTAVVAENGASSSLISAPQVTKLTLWTDIVMNGVARSIHLAFNNCLYHVLLHTTFAIIARRSRNLNLTSETTAAAQNNAQIKQILLIVKQIHDRIQLEYGGVLLDNLKAQLINSQKYTIQSRFSSIDHLRDALFADLIAIAQQSLLNSLDGSAHVSEWELNDDDDADSHNLNIANKNEICKRPEYKLEQMLLSTYHQFLSTETGATAEDARNIEFCEMFYELKAVMLCGDFIPLLSDTYEFYLQQWLEQVVNKHIQPPIAAHLHNGKEPQLQSTAPPPPLIFLKVMTGVMKNFDELMNVKAAVSLGLSVDGSVLDNNILLHEWGTLLIRLDSFTPLQEFTAIICGEQHNHNSPNFIDPCVSNALMTAPFVDDDDDDTTFQSQDSGGFFGFHPREMVSMLARRRSSAPETAEAQTGRLSAMRQSVSNYWSAVTAFW